MSQIRVLYICTGNSFRSPIAEALTRKYYPDMEVESAGTDAVETIAWNAVEFLKGAGAEQFVKPTPDQLSQRALDDADVIVCMKENHKKFIEENFEDEHEIVVWDVDDPITRRVEPEEAFGLIVDKVERLFP